MLKIGMSKSDLREEIMNIFQQHNVANWLAKIRKRSKILVTVDFIKNTVGKVIEIERELLQKFEDEHLGLPITNSQRGYARSQDKHYKE